MATARKQLQELTIATIRERVEERIAEYRESTVEEIGGHVFNRVLERVTIKRIGEILDGIVGHNEAVTPAMRRYYMDSSERALQRFVREIYDALTGLNARIERVVREVEEREQEQPMNFAVPFIVMYSDDPSEVEPSAREVEEMENYAREHGLIDEEPMSEDATLRNFDSGDEAAAYYRARGCQPYGLIYADGDYQAFGLVEGANVYDDRDYEVLQDALDDLAGYSDAVTRAVVQPLAEGGVKLLAVRWGGEGNTWYRK